MQRHLPSSVQELLREHRTKCGEKAHLLRDLHTSVGAYRKTLICEVIDQPDDERLEEFYRLYKSVFTLEDECEPIDGFRRVLNFNSDSNVQRDFGPLYEPIFVLRDPQDGQLVAAANFALYAYQSPPQNVDFDVSCQLHFLLVHADFRGLGIAADLLRHIEASVIGFGNQHCGAHRSFTACEQNNPLKMTADQINADAIAALIDPYDRMAWWRRRGFKKLEVPYVQPRLYADAEPCTYLDYYVSLCAEPDAGQLKISTVVLTEHLRRFFTVSVAKFYYDIAADSDWRNLAKFLSENSHIELNLS